VLNTAEVPEPVEYNIPPRSVPEELPWMAIIGAVAVPVLYIGAVAPALNTPVLFNVTVPPEPNVIVPPPLIPVPAATVSDVLP
jgi:hypothetical protein